MAKIVRRQNPADPTEALKVSRDTAGTQNVLATLGAVPPGLRLPCHAHPGIENVLYLVTGRLVAVVGPEREALEFRAGEFLYLEAGEAHELYNPGDEPALGVSFYAGVASDEDDGYAVMLP